MRVLVQYLILALSTFVGVVFACGIRTSAEAQSNASPAEARILWKSGTSPCPLTKPVVNRDLLFVGSCEGKFYALEKNSGNVVWSYDPQTEGASGSFLISPLLRKDLVIAGTVRACAATEGGYVYGFERRTGKLRWKLKATAASATFADIDETDPNGSVVFGTREGEWLSIEPSSGKVNWRFRATPPDTNCEYRISVATDGVNVCFLAQDGSLRCVDAKSGRELWKRSPSSPVTTQLLMYKDGLYFGTADQRILGIDPENGRAAVELKLAYKPVGGITESERDAGGDFEFAYGMDSPSGQRALLAFSDNFGSVQWSRAPVEPSTTEEPEPWKGLVLAGNCKGDIVAYAASNGLPKWKGHVNGCIKGFSHDDSTLYIAVQEGAIYSYQPSAPALSKTPK